MGWVSCLIPNNPSTLPCLRPSAFKFRPLEPYCLNRQLTYLYSQTTFSTDKQLLTIQTMTSSNASKRKGTLKISNMKMRDMKMWHQMTLNDRGENAEHFTPLLFGSAFSCFAFSTPVIWCRIFMSRIFYPCNFYGAAFSCSAFSFAPKETRRTMLVCLCVKHGCLLRWFYLRQKRQCCFQYIFSVIVESCPQITR